MMNNEQLVAKDLNYVWHPFTQMGVYRESKPIIIKKGRGSYLYDTNGNKYLDGYASLWVNVHGHNNKQLNRALQRQLKQIAHSTLLGSSNIPSIELAEQLVDITPQSLQKVFYSDTGSAAVEIAIKMAYQYWKNLDAIQYAKKRKFLTLHNGYHGDTLGAVSVGGIDTFHQIFEDLIFENIQITSPSLYQSTYETEETMTKAILKEIEAILQQQADEIVGFVIEPLIQGATGGYLPLAATLTSQRIYDAFLSDAHGVNTFFHGHTYTGNQLVCAVALESLKLYKQNHVIQHVQKTSKILHNHLHNLANHPHVGDIRGRGLMYGVELVADKATRQPLSIEKVESIIAECKACGLMIRNLEHVITFVPILTMSKKEIKKMVRIFTKALTTILD